jgi:hypothetical protein
MWELLDKNWNSTNPVRVVRLGYALRNIVVLILTRQV